MKFVPWAIAIVGVIICIWYSLPWWAYIILGIVWFIVYLFADIWADLHDVPQPGAGQDDQDELPEGEYEDPPGDDEEPPEED